MANLYIVAESLESGEETNQIPPIQEKNDALLQKIDDQVEVPLKRGMVLDPLDEEPIDPRQEITHLAVITKEVEGAGGYLYGNSHYQLFEFVRAVLEKTAEHYPRH